MIPQAGLEAAASELPNITILGDSRVFDTYYTNARYRVRYGYDRTFAHRWRKAVLADPAAGYDVVHISDHFRGGTVQNNIIRVALTDPVIVVVLDGIWETLAHKGDYLEYAKRQGLNGEATYNRADLAGLFRAGKLPQTPQAYAARQRRLISYFHRRRRKIMWLTLPVPPEIYVGSTYHAGDYTPVPGWDQCLAAVNEAVVPVVQAYGGCVIDMTAMMNDMGGPEAAFIDQWHFSPEFHASIARDLDAQARRLLADGVGREHVSHRFMLGSPDASADPDVVIYEGDPADELSVLRNLPPEKILLYPDELTSIDNPRGDDRVTFGKQPER